MTLCLNLRFLPKVTLPTLVNQYVDLVGIHDRKLAINLAMPSMHHSVLFELDCNNKIIRSTYGSRSRRPLADGYHRLGTYVDQTPRPFCDMPPHWDSTHAIVFVCKITTFAVNKYLLADLRAIVFQQPSLPIKGIIQSQPWAATTFFDHKLREGK